MTELTRTIKLAERQSKELSNNVYITIKYLLKEYPNVTKKTINDSTLSLKFADIDILDNFITDLDEHICNYEDSLDESITKLYQYVEEELSKTLFALEIDLQVLSWSPEYTLNIISQGELNEFAEETITKNLPEPVKFTVNGNVIIIYNLNINTF